MPTIPHAALNRLTRLTLGPRLTRGGRGAIAALVRNPLSGLTTPAPVNELVLAVLARQGPGPDRPGPDRTAQRGPLVPRVELDALRVRRPGGPQGSWSAR